MKVETREKVARAEPEAGRQHAGAAGGIEHAHVRRVAAARARCLEHVDEGEHAFRFGETGEKGKPGHGLRDAGQAGAREQAAVKVRNGDGLTPQRFVRVEVLGRDETPALLAESQ